jgi:hypothetical protein
MEIYKANKEQRDALEKYVYFKVWLQDKRFMNSQVVCALGGMINFFGSLIQN